MNLKQKRVLVSIISGTILFLIFALYFSTHTSLLRMTPSGIFVLIVIYCIWIFVLYLVLGVKKSEKYLSKVEKWDSPRILGLTVIILWAIFTVLYYLQPKIWTLMFPVCLTIGYLSGIYMRNAYRKELKT